MAGEGGLTPQQECAAAGAALDRAPYAVALSGGADSAVCAWIVQQAGMQVRGIHVHHGLQWSDAMEEAAAEVARHLGLALEVRRVEVPPGPSPEDQARQVRYRALLEALEPAELLATGHTADDQAETILQRLLRGTGPAGLAGIPRRRDRLVRPLLGLRRRQVRAAAGALGIPYRDDPANADLAPLRNRLRHRLLPQLEAEYSADLRAGLARLAALSGEEDRLLAARAAAVPLRTAAGQVLVPAALLAGLPLAVARRVVRRALRRSGQPGADHAAVDRVLAVAAGRPAADVGGGVEARRAGAYVMIGAGPSPPVPTGWEVPGFCTFGSHRLRATVAAERPLAWPIGKANRVVDADRLGSPLQVRAPQRADSIDFGGGSKPVLTALAEAGVAATLRSSWPVVFAGREVVWVPGVRSAAWSWADAATRNFAWLSWEGM